MPQTKGANYKSIYKQARETHQTALTGMFVAAAVKELRQYVMTTMIAVVKHYTMVAVAQQAGAFAISPKPNEQVALDPLVLVDALAVIMGHEEKDLCRLGHIALMLMVGTATTLLGSKEMVSAQKIFDFFPLINIVYRVFQNSMS